MMHFNRNDSRRQAAASSRKPRDGFATVFGMQQDGGVATSGLGKSRQQRLDASSEIGHCRIRMAYRARRTNRRARTAAHAQMRLDRDVIAVSANGFGRTDIDALRATDLLRPAVGADRSLVAIVFRLLEFTDEKCK